MPEQWHMHGKCSERCGMFENVIISNHGGVASILFDVVRLILINFVKTSKLTTHTALVPSTTKYGTATALLAIYVSVAMPTV